MSRVTDEQLKRFGALMAEWRESLLRDVAPALLEEVERGRKELPEGLWTCLGCGFTFDAQHSDDLGGHSCPNCAEQALRRRVRELEEAARAAVEADDAESRLGLAEALKLLRAALPPDPKEKP